MQHFSENCSMFLKKLKKFESSRKNSSKVEKRLKFNQLKSLFATQAKNITDISTLRSKAEESEEKLEDKLTTARTSISKRLGKTKTGAEDKTTDGTSDFPVDFMGASFSDEARRTKQNTEDGVAENEQS